MDPPGGHQPAGPGPDTTQSPDVTTTSVPEGGYMSPELEMTKFAQQLLKTASMRERPGGAGGHRGKPGEVAVHMGGDGATKGMGRQRDQEVRAPEPYTRHDSTDDEEEDEEEEEDEYDTHQVVQNKALLAAFKPPIEHRWNLYPTFLFLWFMTGAFFYFYVRITELNGRYAMFILVTELIGVTSFIPYAILLTRGIYPTGTTGLPTQAEENEARAAQGLPPIQVGGSLMRTPIVKPGTVVSPMLIGSAAAAEHPSRFGQGGHGDEDDVRFHVRVLVPCYKEPLEVIKATLTAAHTADIPARTKRTIYLCDDGKDKEKKALVESMGPDVVYVTGRKRKQNEINGKSANLNNCLQNVIYKNWPRNIKGEIDWQEISNKECLVVFDADMCAKKNFFTRILEVMANEEYALCLSPQAFHNIAKDADLFNNINKQFWECWLPGAFAWGYIACTGTNFCIRARALCHCGWFPEYTITEDYALGMELKCAGYKAGYLMAYIAEGEAPDEIRNVFRQRSRWTKGHFQVFFSRRNSLLNWRLPFFQRLWYAYAAWAPMCTIITLPIFMAVPFISIVFDLNPVVITFRFVLTSTIYYSALGVIQHYAYAWGDWKFIWFANGSNIVLWFTYCKALFNSLIALTGMKIVGFKVTEKKVTTDGAAAPPPPPPRAPSLMQRMVRAMTPRGRGESLLHGDHVPTSHMPPTASGSDPAAAKRSYSTSGGPPPPAIPRSSSYVRGAQPLAVTERAKKDGWQRFKAVVASFKPAHIKDFDEMFDPLVLFLLFAFSTTAFALGIWQTAVNFNTRGSSALALNSPISGSPYLIVATMWAFFNMIFPYLFLHYCFTAGTSFKWAATILMQLSNLVLIISIILLWLLIPQEFDVQEPINLQAANYLPGIQISDQNTLFNFVQGTDGSAYAGALSPQAAAGTRRALQAYEELQRIAKNADLPFDPAAATEADLNGGGALNAWQRSLLQQTSGLDLSGGLFTNADHVKYAMPMAYSVTMMSWALMEFPKGFKASHKAAIEGVIRTGADYLMKCYVQTADGKRAYVAQVGDPANYTAVDNLANDPSMMGLSWTSPQDDPFLNGQQPRRVWVLDEAHVGSDLLSQVAGALAAASLVVNDPGWQDTALQTAQKIYEFAELNGVDKVGKRPPSYCQYVPCSSQVWVQDEQLTVPLSKFPQPPAKDPTKPECYYVDWDNGVCVPGWSVDQCLQVSQTVAEIYNTKASCCGFLSSSGARDGMLTLDQGLCALPDNETTCYVPMNAARTCEPQTVDPRTGLGGCAGKGLEIYSSTESCCNYLFQQGFIDPDKGKLGVGVCAANPTNLTCYIPTYTSMTCIQATGDACAAAGLRAYQDPNACCNDLIPQALSFQKKPTGICKLANVTCFIADQRTFTCNEVTFDNCGLQPDTFTEQSLCCNAVAGYAKGAKVKPTGICASSVQPAPDPVPKDPVPNPVPKDPVPNPVPKDPVPNPVPKARRALLNKQQRQQQAAAAGLPKLPAMAVRRSNLQINLTLDNLGKLVKQSTPVNDTAARWKPPKSPIPDYVECNTYFDCTLRPVLKQVEIAHYNSTSTLDDMAWGAVWLYKALKQVNADDSLIRMYLGKANQYLQRHYIEDITTQTLNRDRSYYVADWNNVAWSTNLLLYKATHFSSYDQMLRRLLNAWVLGKNVSPLKGGLPSAATGVNITANNMPVNYTAPDGTQLLLLPTCNATATYESDCTDGIDNDCDGKIDKFDEDCGVFPMLYNDKNLAYSAPPSLPNAAALSWIAMVYAETQNSGTQRKLRCWALGQAGYIMGVTPDTRSYIVGFRDAPGVVKHRASSCDPNTAILCDWTNAFYPGLPNPQLNLIKGALFNGPDFYDGFSDSRGNNMTEVTLEGTVQLMGALAGLKQTDTRLRSCELMHGVYQKVFTDQQTL